MLARIDLRTVSETLTYIHDDMGGVRELAEARELLRRTLIALGTPPGQRARERMADSGREWAPHWQRPRLLPSRVA